MTRDTLRKRHRIVSGGLALVGSLMCVGVWIGLPARWWPVDAPATVLMAAAWVAAVGLWIEKPWGLKVARVTLWGLLAAGCTTVSLLSWVVAHLAGLYGPVGAGGALLMGVMAVLIAPYLVVFPAVSLSFLRSGR